VTVHVEFRCGGCEAKAWGTHWLKREFRSFSGRTYGIGGTVPSNTIEDITPEGWIAYDPWTYCCYCPKCWTEIQDGSDDEVKP
jgi:hypothetical protein